MSTLRRLATPLRLARLRLAHRLERVALVALGIAAGTAMLAAVLGGSLLARDRSLERATAQISAPDRAVRALWFGIPAQDAPRRQLDAWAEHAIASFGDVTRAMVYRETSVNGHVFDLAAVGGGVKGEGNNEAEAMVRADLSAFLGQLRELGLLSHPAAPAPEHGEVQVRPVLPDDHGHIGRGRRRRGGNRLSRRPVVKAHIDQDHDRSADRKLRLDESGDSSEYPDQSRSQSARSWNPPGG